MTVPAAGSPRDMVARGEASLLRSPRARQLTLLVILAVAVLVRLAYLIACELRRPVVGLVAAAILAVFPGYVLFTPLILSEALFVARPRRVPRRHQPGARRRVLSEHE